MWSPLIRHASRLLLASSFLLGCNASTGSATSSGAGAGGLGGGDGSGGGGGGAMVEPLAWQPCPWFTVPPPDSVPAVDDGQCARLEVPLERDVEGSASIEVVVKRLPAASGNPGRALWLLDGGPGGEGLSMEIYAARWRALLPDVELLVPQHRGVAEATRLDCVGEAAQSPNGFAMTLDEHQACGEELRTKWGEGLRGFSPSEAALDLAEAIAREQVGHASPLPVTVYGGSYGTYWALRLAALAPLAADAIVLDSTCAPGLCWAADRDLGFDDTAETVFTRCLDDATCAAHLGPDPWAKVAAVRAALDQGSCPGLTSVGINGAAVKALLGQLLNATVARAAMAPLIARIERCSADDVTAVRHLFDYVFGGGPSPSATHFGQALYAHIITSELFAPGDPDLPAITAAAEATQVARGTTLFAAALYPIWPRYEPDPTLALTTPSVDVPMLVLHGGLDPLTPPNVVAALMAAYPTAQHVTFADLGHGLVSKSASPNDTQAPTCAMRMVADFVQAPDAPVDTACVTDVFALSFDAPPEQAQLFFGRDDLWD
ncbi:MAG: alpha/beta hydrolase [Myxococcales bacterium]|nr:alpha/beta hydrolase [Myxococcales bacterium]